MAKNNYEHKKAEIVKPKPEAVKAETTQKAGAGKPEAVKGKSSVEHMVYGGPCVSKTVKRNNMLLSEDIIMPKSTAIIPISSVIDEIINIVDGKYKVTVHPVTLNDISNVVRNQSKNYNKSGDTNDQALVYSITGGGGAVMVPVLNIPIEYLKRNAEPSSSIGDKIFQSKNEGIDARKIWHNYKESLFANEGFVPVVNSGDGVVYYYVNIIRLILTVMGLPLKETLDRYTITITTDVQESNYQITLTDKRYTEFR